MTPSTKIHPTFLLTFVTLTSTVMCQDRSRTNIFSSDPIHVEDYGAPPATSTILLYDCTGTHRAKPDNPAAFQVFHNNEWWTQLCQEGLFWNQTLCRCEYPAGKRPERECRDYRATSTEPTGKYEQYVNNNWIIRDCSLAVAGLVWDQDSCQCVWGPRSKEMVTGQGVTPCDIMLNLTFEDGIKDTAKGSFVEVGRGPLVPIFTLDPQDAIDGTKAAFFSETALNIWYFAGNELGTSLRVEFRFKMTNDPSNRDKYQIFISNGCNISNPGYTTPSLAIGYRPADQSYLLAFETASARKAIVCTKRLGAYTWHTVSLIYEDGTLLLRVDDQPCIISQDFTGPIQKTPCPLTIGADPLERQSMYKGYLDNLLIARYCRRFIDSDPAEAEKKGPMPVESVGPLADDFTDPNPPFGKSPNDVRRSVTNSKYIQVVGDNGLESSKKSRPLSSSSDVSLSKEVQSSSKLPSKESSYSTKKKGTEKSTESALPRSSKPIGREGSNDKLHITSSTEGYQNNNRNSKAAADSGKAFIASNTDYFVRGKKPVNLEKSSGYASKGTFDIVDSSQSYIHKVTDSNDNSRDGDDTQNDYGSGKPKAALNNYNPTQSQGMQYGEDATIIGKFNQDKSYGQAIQSSLLNHKEGTRQLNSDRSYDEAEDNYDGVVEVQDRVGSKDSSVDNTGTLDYEEIEDSDDTKLAKEVTWKDSGADISASVNYDTFENSKKEATYKQENGKENLRNDKGNSYNENVRSEKDDQFGKSQGLTTDQTKKKYNSDTESIEWNKSQQSGDVLKNEAVEGTFQSNRGKDVASSYHKTVPSASEGGYKKQSVPGYNVQPKQQSGGGQYNNNEDDGGVEYGEEESAVGYSQSLKNQQTLQTKLNQFDDGKGQETYKETAEVDSLDKIQISKQNSQDRIQDGNSQGTLHKRINQDSSLGISEKADAYNSKVFKNKDDSRNSHEDNVLRNVGRYDNGRSKERNTNSDRIKSNPYTPKPPTKVNVEERRADSNSKRPGGHYPQPSSKNENSGKTFAQRSQNKVSNNPDSFRHKVSNSLANNNKANSGKFWTDQNLETQDDSTGSQRHKQIESGDSKSDDEVKKADYSPVLETQFQIVRPKPNAQIPRKLHQNRENKTDKKEKSNGSNSIFQNSQTRSKVGSSTQLNNFKQGSTNRQNSNSQGSHQSTDGYLHKSQTQSNGYALGTEKQITNNLQSNLNQNMNSQSRFQGLTIMQGDTKTSETDNFNKQSSSSYNEPKSVGLVKGMPKGGKNKKKAWYDKADLGSTNDQTIKNDQKSHIDNNGDERKNSELRKEHSYKTNDSNDDDIKDGSNNNGGTLEDSVKSQSHSVHKVLKQRNLNGKNEMPSQEEETMQNPKHSYTENQKVLSNVARPTFAEPKSREDLPHMRYNVNEMRYPKPFRKHLNSGDMFRDSNQESSLKKEDSGPGSNSKLKGDNSGDNTDSLEYDETEETTDDGGEDEESPKKFPPSKQARKDNANGEFEKGVTVQAEPYHIAEIIKESTTERTVGGGNIYFYVKKGEEPSSITHTAVDAESTKKSDGTEAAKDETLTISNSDLQSKESTKDQTGNENEKPQTPLSTDKVTDNANDGSKVQEPDDTLHVNGGDTTRQYVGDQFEKERPDNIPTTVRQMPLDVSKLEHEETNGSVDPEKSSDVNSEPDAEKD